MTKYHAVILYIRIYLRGILFENYLHLSIKMKKSTLLLCFFALVKLWAQKTPNDGDWTSRNEVLKNTPEAEVMIRVGDIDNLGFGLEENFDPFCGKTTNNHPFPWYGQDIELAGMDRILLSTSFHKDKSRTQCDRDGYSVAEEMYERPSPIKMNLQALQNTDIRSASLMIFVDDFQAVVLCSEFKVYLNGTRFIGMERVLNHLDQTGPIGKIVHVKLPDYMLPLLKSPELSILIDDSTSYAADGYSIDFVKLLVNPKMDVMCKGSVKGQVFVRDTETPIANATLQIPDVGMVKTNGMGEFYFQNLTAGLNVADVSAEGYVPAIHTFDIAQDEILEGMNIYLDIAQKVSYNGQEIETGKSIVLNNIQFELAKYDLSKEAKQELDKLAAFMKENENLVIELSGHTSADGTVAGNQLLSTQRVKSCQQYLAEKGIAEKRVLLMGYGQDKPIAPNDTPANRAKNRRVELKIVKI